MPEFWQTEAGHRFFEGTLPRLTDTLKLLSDQIKRANDLKEHELKETLRSPYQQLCECPQFGLDARREMCPKCGKKIPNYPWTNTSDRPDGGPPAESQQERMGTEDDA